MILVYVTYPSRDEALAVSKDLLKERLVACANIFPGAQSLYWWEGQIQDECEVAVIYKSRADLFTALNNKIMELHSYDVPCVVTLSIEDGNPDFLEWIEAQTSI